MSGPSAKPPKVRDLPAVKAAAAALAAGEERRDRIRAQAQENQRKINEYSARTAATNAGPSADRLVADAARVVKAPGEAESIAAARDAEENAKGLAACCRRRELLREAAKQSDVLLNREEEAFSAAAAAAVAPQYMEILRAKVGALLELGRCEIADTDFRDGLARQGVNVVFLPNMVLGWLGDMRVAGTGPIHEALEDSLELGIVDELPRDVAEYTRSLGLGRRAEREAALRPSKKANVVA